MQLPSPGIRLRLSGHLSTVRFVGEVQGTRGTWLGVEWDDPSRGKHDGMKDGVRYFTCLTPNSGSFIRPTAPGISYGQSFLAALTAKYVEENHGPNETVVLGSSNGAIEVEVANLDMIRGNLARLETLREVSVEDVSSVDPPGDIRKKTPSIRGLDLSDSLLPSWDMVALITAELPVLERLSLNRTRLRLFGDLPLSTLAFRLLVELQISATMTKWPELLHLLQFMPSVSYVEMGLNQLTQLTIPTSGALDQPGSHCNIEVLNLDSNLLDKWEDLCRAFQPFSALRRLLLTANHFEKIPIFDPGQGHAPLAVEQLLLTANRIQTWEDIDHLGVWVPNLARLRLRDNPIHEDETIGKYYRQFVVAKIPSLVELDGTVITAKERRDCEIFYISHISRIGPPSEDERERAHPRWKELCERWGAPDETPKVQDGQNTLGSQLININMHRCTSPAIAHALSAGEPTALKVLKTMTLKTLRLKILKSLKLPRKPSDATTRLWLKMDDGGLAELDGADDVDLTWWGLEDGANVFFYFGN